MPTTFFDLPRELRDKVYNFAWQNSGLFELCEDRICHAFGNYPSCKNSSIAVTTGIPGWLLTNKAFLFEGLFQFERFEYIDLSYQDLESDDIPPQTIMSRLISPATVRELRVSVEATITYHDRNGNYIGFFITQRHLSHLAGELDYVAALRNLRVLKIEILIYVDEWARYPQSRIVATLGPVLQPVLPLLDHFELSIRCRPHGKEAWVAIHRAIISDMGKLNTMIGNEWDKGTNQQIKASTINYTRDRYSTPTYIVNSDTFICDMSLTTFFHLPRELRDQIYTILLATTYAFQIHANMSMVLIA
ncbi:hypothetical protein BKA63DRAFT_567708 [Paraphoma chrysanthemicola]|nr:hypothetical protein BKA63DRAFT_567708 [Paraphoma chrysanthemicola]